MPNLIEERVALAREGNNPYVIRKMPSGWLVIGDVQPLAGYCLLLSDPVVASINDLGQDERARYSLDTIRIGDALMAVTGSYRINYETLGNFEPALHTHIIPRYLTEPDEKRGGAPFMHYDWATARKFDPVADAAFVDAMRKWLDTN